MSTLTRIPEVRTLAQILPSGTEGGKEFSRIVDLLLFYLSMRNGETINLFSDRAGDFYGLDSFDGGGYRQERSVGYQYKFFPSPLSSSHRSQIIESLKNASENQKRLKLQKWILVTPDDLVQANQKQGGGDVDWFLSLRTKLNTPFEIEHWGHRKLQALFLETPRLCLYYYPDLVKGGASTIISIQETRKKYDLNLRQMNERIEFVGMSVYKAEATHGVQMEEIYIPVSAVPFPLDSTKFEQRTNPITFLTPGARHVILGDPGSGKSTLLRFLSIAGQLESLQKRYNAPKDNRIAIPITLRKYSDALKSESNLSLLDFIVRTTKADFSLTSATAEFFEFYLESGQAIVLFDGIDELPDASYKKIVRDRINSFLNCYPMSTALITSRIVGYSPAFGFDRKTYHHFQLAPLLLTEIKSFVCDWYRARIENSNIRNANINDLIRILENPEQTAIRTLAENPLLLTIVTLVHRIDAVLPDERVVLYQKCTETLLNTWHTWKYKGIEDQIRKGRIERTNRRRIEALAYHMHINAGAISKTSRAVLLEDEVLKVLMTDIRRHDNVSSEEEARDAAIDFLKFVKQKAGLLIEVGDQQYSFIHLTFQEYLTATALTSAVEVGGVRSLWESVQQHLDDPRWQEVIRLLVAALKSDESQEFIVERIIEANDQAPNLNISCLLGGLLLDGVKSAEQHQKQILASLFTFLNLAKSDELNSKIVELLSMLVSKHRAAWHEAFKECWRSNTSNRGHMLLLCFAIDLSSEAREELMQPQKLDSAWEIERFALLLGEVEWPVNLSRNLIVRYNNFVGVLAAWARTNPLSNFLTCIAQGAMSNLPAAARKEYLFRLQFSLFTQMRGPFEDFYRNYSFFNLTRSEQEHGLDSAIRKAMLNYDVFENPRRNKNSRTIARLRSKVYEEIKVDTEQYVETASRDFDKHSHERIRLVEQDDRSEDIEAFHERHGSIFYKFVGKQMSSYSKDEIADFLADLKRTDGLLYPISEAQINYLDLEPRLLWERSLSDAYLNKLIMRIDPMNNESLEFLLKKFKENRFTQADCWEAASFYLYDIWLYIFHGYDDINESPIAKLEQVTEKINFSALRVARDVRSIIRTQLVHIR